MTHFTMDINLNNSQLKMFHQMLTWYMMEENDIIVPEIMDYCHDRNISLRDEMQFYIYLYGVHENQRFETNNTVSQKWNILMMEQFEDAVQRCDYVLNGRCPYSPIQVPSNVEPPQLAPIDIRVSPIVR